MNIREFYERTGGDYAGVMDRFYEESRVRRFLRMFKEDPSFPELEARLEEDRLREAFLAVHTLKGVCLNIGFNRLYGFASDVTEALRAEDKEKALELMPGLRQCYGEILGVIDEVLVEDA